MIKSLKFFLLLTIVSINLNGQATYFNEKSVVANENEFFHNLSKKSINGYKDYVYCFISCNNLYVLSYRNDNKDWSYIRNIERDTVKRELLLYRQDDTGIWYEASNTVQVDVRYYTTYRITFNDGSTGNQRSPNHSFLLAKGLGYGKIRILNNGCIVLLLCNESNVTQNNGGIDTYHYNAVAILVPNGEGTYVATRFEPVNKETRVPDLAATDTLVITESDNRIALEFWNRMTCGKDELPDGYVSYNSDTNGKTLKIPYKRELIATLNFDLYGTKVSYSGKYDLIQKQ